MRNLFHINESEKERILDIHQESTKRQYLKESKTSITEANGQTKAEYPVCVQSFGEPYFTEGNLYVIAGTGNFKGYYFYNNSRVTTPKGIDSYYCSGNKVVIGKKPSTSVASKNTTPSKVAAPPNEFLDKVLQQLG